MTFGDLRKAIFEKAGVENIFQFRSLSPQHSLLMDHINRVEYDIGYNSEEYLKPGTPALSEMDLLSQEEFDRWLERLEAVNIVAYY